jgi:hypothetical protein
MTERYHIAIGLSNIKLSQADGQLKFTVDDLIHEGVFQGLDGKRCYWSKENVAQLAASIKGKPLKFYHQKEGQIPGRTRYSTDNSPAGSDVGVVLRSIEQGGKADFTGLVVNDYAKSVVLSNPDAWGASLEADVFVVKSPNDKADYHINEVTGTAVALTEHPVMGNTIGREEVVILSMKQDGIDLSKIQLDEGSKPDTPPAETAPNPLAAEVDSLKTELSEMKALLGKLVEKKETPEPPAEPPKEQEADNKAKIEQAIKASVKRSSGTNGSFLS